MAARLPLLRRIVRGLPAPAARPETPAPAAVTVVASGRHPSDEGTGAAGG